MPKLTAPTNISDTRLYNKQFSKFRGVDFSTDPTQVADERSPICQNLISDLSGFPEKRLGWRKLFDLGAEIYGIYHCVFESGRYARFVHAGTNLYTWTDSGAVALDAVMNNAKSRAFAHSGKLYILDGLKYRVVTEADGEYTVSDVEGFTPTTVIGAPAAGGGTALEAVNLLSNKRINSMIGDGTSTVYHLDSQNIDNVISVKVDGAVKAEGDDYTVDLTAGTVTFNVAPPEYAGGSGIDNVVIEFAKTVEGYADRINKCRICETYGYNNDNRFFFTGNPDYPNTDWQSGLDDPTYFPDTGYTKVGADTSAIMGYLKQLDTLTIIKEDNNQDAEVFLRTSAMTEDGTVYFPVKQGAVGMGAISSNCFANMRDDPLFLTREGVYALASTSVTQERSLQDRSYYVNAQLTKEPDLKDAVAVVWNGYYVLAVNGHCYVADRRQQTGRSNTEQYSYEWYFWTNIPAKVFYEVDGALYFGTEDGRMCKFNTDINTVSKYSDDGAAIEAIWSTKSYDYGTMMRYKTLTKKGCGIMIKPYTRSSIKIFSKTNKAHETFLRSSTMDIFDFSDIDFERFTFNTLDTPQVVAFNKKIKKFIVLQLIFKNDELNEGFGIYGVEVQYAIGNYVK